MESKERNIDYKGKLHEFYQLCKDMPIDEYTDLLTDEASLEEKEFYVKIMEFFMRKRQKKIINMNIF